MFGGLVFRFDSILGIRGVEALGWKSLFFISFVYFVDHMRSLIIFLHFCDAHDPEEICI